MCTSNGIEIGVWSAHRPPALWTVALHLSIMSEAALTFMCKLHHELRDCWIPGGVLQHMSGPFHLITLQSLTRQE